jgi:hypothetical protein
MQFRLPAKGLMTSSHVSLRGEKNAELTVTAVPLSMTPKCLINFDLKFAFCRGGCNAAFVAPEGKNLGGSSEKWNGRATCRRERFVA